MIQNYFGEETIWKLLANNPYEKNNAQSITLHYRAYSITEHDNIVKAFLNNIPGNHIVNIEEGKPPIEWGCANDNFTIIKKIVVRNVFGNLSEVKIMDV